MLWKESLRGTSRMFFLIVHWSGSAHMFLLQALGWWRYRKRYNVIVTLKQTSHTVNIKMQQKITYLILCCVNSDWFHSIQIWALKTIFRAWKPFYRRFKPPKTLQNRDTNAKNILASLARIFSWWNSFWNSFKACFNFNLIIVCTSHCKRKKTVVF